jgi:hypothetical protein
MSLGRALFAFGMLRLVLSFLPVFPDPYHEDAPCVDFWTWSWREIDELVKRER